MYSGLTTLQQEKKKLKPTISSYFCCVGERCCHFVKLKMAVSVDSTEIFSNLSAKIGNIHFRRTEGDRNILSKTLDELNSINYRYTVVTSPTKAVLLVNQCCSFIPTDDEILVQKCSQLLWNLVNRQNIVVEGRTLTISIQWCLEALKIRDKNVILDVLQALDSLLRSSVKNVRSLVHRVTREIRTLLKDREGDVSLEVVLLAVQCLEACTTVPNDFKSSNQNDLFPSFDLCAETFNLYLHKKPTSLDNVIYNKILKLCLNGLQNIIIQNPDYLKRELGVVLGIIKTFMLYGIKGVDYIAPQKLFPSTLSVPEIPNNVLHEKKGGKLTKQRKHRSSGANKKEKNNDEYIFDNKSTGYTPASTTLDYNSDCGTNYAGTDGRLKTSDSDFSDSEAGKAAKCGQIQSRIRQATLNLFCTVVKQTEKSTMFSYWSSFIPESSASGQHNLVTCTLKDPSARGRMAALNVLLLLLTTSKTYLLQAESSEKSTSFTPFSVVLGFMLKELHKGLSLALNEMSVPVLTQVLKCFAALVQATPYHKMSQGFVSKVVRNVKPFIYYKDASIQVTALIVLGCVLASEPVIPETKEAMLRLRHRDEGEVQKKRSEKIDNAVMDGDFDYAEFSESEEEESVGNETIPWLPKRCLSNLGVNFDENSKELNNSETIHTVVPAPVKLESLQVLSAMSRNYFDVLMAPHIGSILKALDISLSDRYTDLRLHAGRAVDFIGQAMNRYISNEDTRKVVSIEHCLQFWQTLLNGSLIELLQSEQYSVLRAVGCDCLGSIGSQIFEQLPRGKQFLCVTLLFSCTRDEENSVKGAAVRALAICVLYPSLREDTGFVIDTAEAIYRTLTDENLMVRVKSSWSLGNLSDALVLNSKSENNLEEIPESLILKLLEAGICGAADNDKIKMNAVRAIGNLLQLITPEQIKRGEFVKLIEQAFSALVKSCTTGSNMKVRWNACYALGNAMSNPALYVEDTSSSANYLNRTWQSAVFNSLMELVENFRNFKVRINAALALSSPPLREHYGVLYHFVWISLLKALENSQNMEDFSEYKHRDHLIEQVCLALGHLTTLLQKDDLLQLQFTLQLYFDAFKCHTHKVFERVIPEKSTALFSASYALAALSKQPDLSEEQQEVLTRLTEIFTPDL